MTWLADEHTHVNTLFFIHFFQCEKTYWTKQRFSFVLNKIISCFLFHFWFSFVALLIQTLVCLGIFRWCVWAYNGISDWREQYIHAVWAKIKILTPGSKWAKGQRMDLILETNQSNKKLIMIILFQKNCVSGNNGIFCLPLHGKSINESLKVCDFKTFFLVHII